MKEENLCLETPSTEEAMRAPPGGAKSSPASRFLEVSELYTVQVDLPAQEVLTEPIYFKLTIHSKLRDCNWQIERRYSDFEILVKALAKKVGQQACLGGDDLGRMVAHSLPPKHPKPRKNLAALSERAKGLEAWASDVLSLAEALDQPAVVAFFSLDLPRNASSTATLDEAQRAIVSIQKAFRNSPKFAKSKTKWLVRRVTAWLHGLRSTLDVGALPPMPSCTLTLTLTPAHAVLALLALVAVVMLALLVLPEAHAPMEEAAPPAQCSASGNFLAPGLALASSTADKIGASAKLLPGLLSGAKSMAKSRSSQALDFAHSRAKQLPAVLHGARGRASEAIELTSSHVKNASMAASATASRMAVYMRSHVKNASTAASATVSRMAVYMRSHSVLDAAQELTAYGLAALRTEEGKRAAMAAVGATFTMVVARVSAAHFVPASAPAPAGMPVRLASKSIGAFPPATASAATGTSSLPRSAMAGVKVARLALALKAAERLARRASALLGRAAADAPGAAGSATWTFITSKLAAGR